MAHAAASANVACFHRVAMTAGRLRAAAALQLKGGARPAGRAAVIVLAAWARDARSDGGRWRLEQRTSAHYQFLTPAQAEAQDIETSWVPVFTGTTVHGILSARRAWAARQESTPTSRLALRASPCSQALRGA